MKFGEVIIHEVGFKFLRIAIHTRHFPMCLGMEGCDKHLFCSNVPKKCLGNALVVFGSQSETNNFCNTMCFHHLLRKKLYGLQRCCDSPPLAQLVQSTITKMAS